MTSHSERDRSIERMLRPALRSGNPPESGGSCLDPETLAAWTDGTLPADQVASLENHAATCTRCQAMLAAMARTAPPPSTSVRSWRSWLVPVAMPLGAAAVLAIAVSVMVIRRDAPPVEDEPQAAAPSSAQDYVLPDNQASQRAFQSGPEPLGGRQTGIEERAQSKVESPAARTRPESGGSASNLARRGELPAAAPAAPSVSRAPEATAESITVLSDSALAPIEIASSDPARRWRIGRGRVERSTDGGVTWTTQYADARMVLVAGAAASPDVAWVVGRAGLVLVSADGLTWRRVAFPHRVDLVAVRAVDAAKATVVAADGRSFVTADAGFTWDPAPLQEFPAAPF